MSDDIDNFMPYLEEVASKAHTILEIGVGKGTGSTLAFMRGLIRGISSEPLFISVDHQDYMQFKPTVSWWHLVIGDSRSTFTADAVEHILTDRPDIIFIDTDHTPEQIKMELEVWRPLAKLTTVWLFHDTYMMGKYNPMTDAIKEFAAKNGWQYEDVFTEAHGLGRMYR